MPRYYRKIIKITAECSPNVRYGLAQQRAGIVPDGRTILPGVLPWSDYCKRRELWDAIRQCIGLDAEFYEGAEILLFPPLWLNHAEKLARQYRGRHRQAKAIGIDPAEGGDKTAMAAVDELGLIELVSKKTPDTNIVPNETIAFARKHNVSPDYWVFDRGGGGKQHADRLRAQGYPCRTVGFGETLNLEPRRGMRMIEEKKEVREERYAYVNRRAELFGELSQAMDPAGLGFAIPESTVGEAYARLRQELAPIPKLYDSEGRLFLPPKHKKDPKSTTQTLEDLIGFSPDEADAVCLARWGMVNKPRIMTAGAV